MFCFFAPVTRHSFQAMCTVFSRKDFFRLFDGLLRISIRKTNAEPRCLTSLGGHDGAICAAKHLELVHVHHLANPYTDLTNSVRGTNISFGKPILSFETQITPFGGPNIFFGKPILFFETQITPFGEPNISFGKPILSFETQLIPFGEPLEKQMIPGMGTETSVTRTRWSIQHSVVAFT